MSRKIIFIALFSFILALFAAGVIFYSASKNNPDLSSEKKSSTVSDTKKINSPSLNSAPFFVSGWIPYWRKSEGADSLSNNLNLFSELNPFAFGVSSDGDLIDTAKINSAPWPKLFREARTENVRIVPTILWTDASAMHEVFASPALLNKHVDAIAGMLQENNFSGADIDYEGKNISDRDNFSLFLKDLHQKLQPLGKSLNCTVEARTDDLPPAGWTGTRAMSWANDYPALNEYCDSVRIMAYDEVFQVYRSQTFENAASSPTASNADNRWVEQVMQYALRYISPQKLILGIPTYGWEFRVVKNAGGFRYTNIGSISYSAAMAEATSEKVIPKRTDGGELSFAYQTNDGEHLVTFEDAESIRQKISIAQKLRLGGISLFKIDGSTDPQFFSALTGLVSN